MPAFAFRRTAIRGVPGGACFQEKAAFVGIGEKGVESMKATTRIGLSLCCVILLSAQAYGQQAKPDTARIEQLTGAKGTFDEKEGNRLSIGSGKIYTSTASGCYTAHHQRDH